MTVAPTARRDARSRTVMPTIPFRLAERLLDAAGRCAAVLRLSGAGYIRRAWERMNRDTCSARLRAERLRTASGRIRHESMEINAEFDAIERDVDA